MAYDPELDKEIARKEVEVGGITYVVSLKSYNGAEPKVVIEQKGSRFPVRRLAPAVFLKIAEAVGEMAPPA
jgi:hypothetical protein